MKSSVHDLKSKVAKRDKDHFKHVIYSKIDDLDLFIKPIFFLKKIDKNILISILNYIKRLHYFPNAYIIYIILLTILHSCVCNLHKGVFQ